METDEVYTWSMEYQALRSINTCTPAEIKHRYGGDEESNAQPDVGPGESREAIGAQALKKLVVYDGPYDAEERLEEGNRRGGEPGRVFHPICLNHHGGVHLSVDDFPQGNKDDKYHNHVP